MKPDRAARLRVLESFLDDLFPVFCPASDDAVPWSARAAGLDPVHALYHRCEVKRLRIGRAAELAPDRVREHAELLLTAVVHDDNPSGGNQLVRPLVLALGRRAVREALIERVRTGTDAEVVGAVLAWHWVPMPVYRRDADASQRAAALADAQADEADSAELRADFWAACQQAAVSRADPEVRRFVSAREGLLRA